MVDLFKAAATPAGLYYFRVIVRFLVMEEIMDETEDGEPLGPIQGFYRTYGVSAKSMTEATSILEESLAAAAGDDPVCEFDTFHLDILDPESIELDTDEWKTRPGVHFVSGRCFYSDDDTPKDNDISGWQAIQEEIGGSEDPENGTVN